MSAGAILNVDWLALTIRYDYVPDYQRVTVPFGYRLRFFSATNVWSSRIVLYTDCGDKVATILCNPRQRSIIKPNVGLVEIANEWLYHGAGWPLILDVCAHIIPFEIVGVSRADICADFEPDERQRDIICGLAEKRYYVQGKGNGSLFWSVNSPDVRLAQWVWGIQLPHQQSWGHKTSNLKWKIYFKTKELRDVEDKPYIRDQWLHEGFDVTNVWRLELSMMYGSQHLLADRPITYDVFNHEWYSVLRSFYQQRFVIRKNQGHKDRSNDERVDLIPILSVSGTDVRCRPPINERRKNGRIPLLRKLIASISDEAVLMSDVAREGVFGLIEEICQADHLTAYASQVVGGDIWSWMEEQRCEAYHSLGGDAGKGLNGSSGELP